MAGLELEHMSGFAGLPHLPLDMDPVADLKKSPAPAAGLVDGVGISSMPRV